MSESKRQVSGSIRKIAQAGGGSPAVAAKTAAKKTPYTPPEIDKAFRDGQSKTEGMDKKRADKAAPLMAEYLDNLRPFAEAGYKSRKSLEKDCKAWFDKPSSFRPPLEKEVRQPLDKPKLTFDAGHGKLHFGGDPTAKKSKWSLEQDAAIKLMEAAIEKSLEPLGMHSVDENPQGWATFYISEQHNDYVGRYVGSDGKGKGGYPKTMCFSMQVQVNYKENTVVYHGYPDETLDTIGNFGCKKTATGASLS